MTARPPALRTAASISGESVATTTGPTAAASRPAQHVHDHRHSGDIGERLARQTGRRHAGRNKNETFGHRFGAAPNRLSACAYTGCKTRGKPAISAPPLPSPSAEPLPDEFVRTQQDSRRVAGNLPGPDGRSPRQRRDFLHAGAGQARLRDRRQGRKARPQESRQARRAADRNACWRAPRSSMARRSPSNAAPATTSRRARAPKSVPTFTASSDARSHP